MTPPLHDDHQNTGDGPRTAMSDLGPTLESHSRPRTVGGMLRAEREGLRVDLQQVAAQLRIRYQYLVAIEEGQYAALPGPTYVVGFVRSYAEYLGLDPQDVIARFRQEVSGLDARPDLAFPVPVTRRSVPGGAILVTALILAVCGYGTWYYLATGQRPRQEQVAAVPSRLLDLLPEAAKSPNEPQGQNEAAPPLLIAPNSTGQVGGGSPPPAAQSGAQTTGTNQAGRSGVGATPTLPPGSVLPVSRVTAGSLSAPSAGPAAAGSTSQFPTAPAAFPATASSAPASPATAPAAAAVPAPAARELTPAQLNQAQLDLLNRPSRAGAMPALNLPAPTQIAAAPAFTGMQPAPETSSVSTTQSLNLQQLTQTTPRPAPAAATASTAALNTAGVPVVGGGSGSRVTIHATVDSWVQVSDGNQRVFARLLKAGETLRVPDKSGMTLRTGNAGGIDIAVDGRPVQSLGAVGAVKSVSLEPQKLMSGDAGQE